MMPRSSLRVRLILIGVVLPSILLLGLLGYLGYSFNRSYREARLAPARLAVQQVGYTLEQVSTYIDSIYDLAGMNGYLSSLSGDERSITFVAILDEQGKAIYHSQPQMAMRTYADLSGLEVGESERYLTTYNADFYLIVRSLAMPGNGAQRLYVVVGVPSSALATQHLILAPIALTIVVFMLIVFLFRMAITRWVIVPVTELAEGAARLGAGDLAYRLPESAPSELGFLARTLNGMAERLQGMIVSLEERVAERTAALSRRNQQLEAVMMVAGEAARTREVSSLLQTAVRAISQYFGFYHAGIFLLDDMRKWAILRAASSEGGKRMLARGHRLLVGRQGIVGTVAATGKPRIALDVGDDAVWFNNPDLPYTRSEMALPLRDEEGNVIGVLDVQSEEPRAFTNEDISVLQLLADQISIALQNATLIERTQRNLREMELLQRNHMQEGWARVVNRLRAWAYEYDRVDVRPVVPLPLDPRNVQEIVPSEGEDKPFVIEPMRYRDQAIGLIALSDPNRRWTDEEIALVRDVSEQLSIALENARLFEEAQRSARHQALLNDVLQAAAKSANPDDALRDIANILAKGLGMAVGVFTFVRRDVLSHVRLLSFVSPDQEELLPYGSEYELSDEVQTFLRGLRRAETGQLFPLPFDEEDIQPYDLSQALYLTIYTSHQVSGFLVLVQRRDMSLLDPDTRELVQNIASQVTIILENINLLEESRRRSEEMQLLYDISIVFGRQLDAVVARQMLVEQMAQLIDADGTAFVAYDGKKRRITVTEAYGALSYLKGQVFSLGEGLSRTVFEELRALLVEDYSAVEMPLPSFAGWVGSVVAAPITPPQGVIGALLAVRRQGRLPFLESHRNLVSLMTAQAAVVLENARLYQESSQRAEALQHLYNAGLDLVSVLDVERIVQAGAEWAQRMFGVEIAVAYYWDERREQFVIGMKMRDGDAGLDESMLLPQPGGLLYRLMESGESLRIPDLSEGALSVDVTRYGLHSLAAVPIQVRARTLGSLFALSGEEDFFTGEDVQRLEFLGTQMATAIQNALYLRSAEEARAITERQARYQSGVARAMAILSERGSGAMQDVLEIIAEAMEVPWAYYLAPLQTEDGEFVWVPTYTWAKEGFTSGERLSWRMEDLPNWSKELLEGNGIVLATASNAPLPERQLFERFHSRAALLVAIPLPNDQPPAVMGFTDFEREREWGDEVVNAVQTLAMAVSSTLAREHLFQRVQEALSESEVLYRAAQDLNVAVTYEDIIAVLRKYTLLGERADYIFIHLFDRPWSEQYPPQRLLTLAAWGRERKALPMERSIAIPSPELFAAIDPSEIIIVDDLEQIALLSDARRQLFREMGMRSGLLVPMVVSGQWIGFIDAFYAEPMKVPPRAMARLKTLVAQAAVAVQNRFQLEVTASRARRERLIRQIGERLQHATDIESLLATTAEELGRSLQARYTAVHVYSRRAAASLGEDVLTPSREGEGSEPEA